MEADYWPFACECPTVDAEARYSSNTMTQQRSPWFSIFHKPGKIKRPGPFNVESAQREIFHDERDQERERLVASSSQSHCLGQIESTEKNIKISPTRSEQLHSDAWYCETGGRALTVQFVLSTVSGMSPRAEEFPAFLLADIVYTVCLFVKWISKVLQLTARKIPSARTIPTYQNNLHQSSSFIQQRQQRVWPVFL